LDTLEFKVKDAGDRFARTFCQTRRAVIRQWPQPARRSGFPRYLVLANDHFGQLGHNAGAARGQAFDGFPFRLGR